MRQFFDLVSNEKGFSHPVIGSERLNRLGLHTARVVTASLCSRLRRLSAPPADAALSARLWRDGYLILPDILPPAEFEAARAEFRARWAAHEGEVPRPPVRSRGFGPRLPHAHGFDRADGGSLNRFVRIDERCPTLLESFVRNGELRRLLRSLTGVPVPRDVFWLYQLVHGDEAANPDLQREAHCDTFHDTFKLWYFFDAVSPADGPLMYAPGSHRTDAARRGWEQRKILVDRARSSAFRASAKDLRSLGVRPLQPLLAPSNALILANTRGFHCRGNAPAGTVRQGLHAGLRPRAFSLWAGSG